VPKISKSSRKLEQIPLSPPTTQGADDSRYAH
jgi:hypothetical protein